MLVILRVGPIVNSELRNAGLPEWVRERLPGEYHSELYPTPEWYFNAVNIYYQQLANQVKEFFPSKGGNIVMVQIDNETHVSWIWGRKETRPAAQVTINRLQQLAKETGFEGPFSCTGWLGDLGVMAEGSLPLTGAYLLNEWSPFQPPMAFDVPFEVRPSHYFNHHQVTLKMCDYASAGNGWSSDDLFRVWLPRPLFLRNAYPADTWRLMYPEIKDDHCPTIPWNSKFFVENLSLSLSLWIPRVVSRRTGCERARWRASAPRLVQGGGERARGNAANQEQ